MYNGALPNVPFSHFIFHFSPLIFLIKCNSVVTSSCHIMLIEISNKKQPERQSFG